MCKRHNNRLVQTIFIIILASMFYEIVIYALCILYIYIYTIFVMILNIHTIHLNLIIYVFVHFTRNLCSWRSLKQTTLCTAEWTCILKALHLQEWILSIGRNATVSLLLPLGNTDLFTPVHWYTIHSSLSTRSRDVITTAQCPVL